MKRQSIPRRRNTNEEKVDRRAHWIQIIVTGIVLATLWCARLEYTVQDLKKDSENREANVNRYRDERTKELQDMKIQVAIDKTNIEWLKKEKP